MHFQIKAYIEFLIKSTNEHGVHSPFVFDLVTKCFYDKRKYAEYSVLKEYRNSLLNDKNIIAVTDFGSGSKVFKSNLRQVSQIAKTAGITENRAELLFRIAKYFQPEAILELGTSLGLATVAMSTANPTSNITTLEGCPETTKIARQLFEKCGNSNIKSICTEFETFLKLKTSNHYQLIYFDGNHSKDATLKYVELLTPTITNETVWIFDDVHWSADMDDAWNTIKQNPSVTVTIDTFQWGFVFFRREQKKEHFTVRV